MPIFDANELDASTSGQIHDASALDEAKPESPGFVQNFKEEVKGGLRQAFNPSKGEFLGSDKIENEGVRNAISSLMGVAKTLYSVPNAAAKTFVGDPLRSEAAPYTPERLAQMKKFEPGLYEAISKMSPEEQTQGKQRAAGLAEGMAGLGASFGGGKLLADSPNFIMRMFGKALDPLASSSPRVLEKATGSLKGRVQHITDLEGQIAKGNEGVEGLQSTLKTAQKPVDDIERQINELKLAATESKEAKLAQTERIPAQPTPPEVTSIPGASTAQGVGETFKGEVIPGAREALYGESKARYDALREQGAGIPLPDSALGEIDATITKLGSESRLPSQAGTVAGQVKLGEEVAAPGSNPLQLGGRPGADTLALAGSTWRDLDPSNMQALIDKGLKGSDLVKAVGDGLTGEGATMANAMRADQILSAAERAYARSGDIAARAAAKELRAPILKALEESPLAEGLSTAKSLHRETSELVGPRSLAERVFKTKPEQVVDNIFLPEARGNANTSIIKDAKQIYQKVAPGEWPKVTGEALAKLQQRSIGSTGQIDPQKFARNWRSYRSTFEAALEPGSFKAVDQLAQNVQKFNQSRQVYQQQLAKASNEAGAMRAYYARQSAQFQVEGAKLGVQRSEAMQGVKAIEEQIHDANKAVTKLQEDLARTKTFGMKGSAGAQMAVQAAMSPHMMIAVAQLGQGIQAMFTGNLSGAGRQFAQGVVWATLGNPMWLMKIAQNPQLAKALDVALMAQKGSRIGVQGARLLGAATKAMGDEIYQEGEQR